MDIPSNTPQCQGDGFCRPFKVSLDGKCFVQTFENLWGHDPRGL